MGVNMFWSFTIRLFKNPLIPSVFRGPGIAAVQPRRPHHKVYTYPQASLLLLGLLDRHNHDLDLGFDIKAEV